MEYLFDSINPILFSLLITILIVLFSYIIEKITGLRLFIDHYTWIKSPNNVRVLSDRDTGYFVILNIGVFIYFIYNDKIEINWIVLTLWILIMTFITKYFYKIHKKYQKSDQTKSDDDFI